MRFLGRSVLLGAIAAALIAPASSRAADAAGPRLSLATDARVCGAETLRQERAMTIPDRLLHAISLVESGRWDADRQASFAWPWTVTAEGEGHFLPSKQSAIAEVERLHARGVTNIDVGCMQVNLQAHPDAFATLDEAFDPATNVAFGARFLTELHDSTHDWEQAGAFYHSQTPSLASAYKTKLVAAWSAARKRADDRTGVALVDLDVEAPIGMVLPTPPQDMATPEQRAAESIAAAKAVAEQTAAAATLAKTTAERAEAKRMADAYRAARIAEFRAHKLQMADAHG